MQCFLQGVRCWPFPLQSSPCCCIIQHNWDVVSRPNLSLNAMIRATHPLPLKPIPEPMHQGKTDIGGTPASSMSRQADPCRSIQVVCPLVVGVISSYQNLGFSSARIDSIREPNVPSFALALPASTGIEALSKHRM